MFSGRRSARSEAGLAVDAGASVRARFAASVSGTTGVEVFSGKIRNPRGYQSQAISPIFPEEMRIREQKSEVGGQKTQPTPCRYSRVSELTIRYANRRLPEDDPDPGVLTTARYKDRVRRNF